MKIKPIAILVVIVSILLVSSTAISQESNLINKREIVFSVNPVIDIGDCIKWHIDFSELKSTVLYKDHFISMGLYGGMIAVDTGLSRVNIEYSRKLNSDLYTNLTVRHDTLFAEKFNNIFYLSKTDTLWFPYVLNEPVLLFDIIYEDDYYVFYPISHGEFGTILFVYDKIKKTIRAAGFNEKPKCIFQEGDVYHINLSLRHGSGSSAYFTLQNVDELTIINPKKYKRGCHKTVMSYFLNMPIEDFMKFNYVKLDADENDDIFVQVLPIDYGIMLNNTFTINSNRFHFTDYNRLRQSLSYHKTYITEIIDNNLQIIDSIDSYPLYRTRNYERFTIMEAYFYGDGYYLSNGDSLFHIIFRGSPDYNMHNYYSSKDNWIKIGGKDLITKVCRETYVYEPEFSRKLVCRINDNVKVYSFGDNEEREQYIQIDDLKRVILLYSKENVIDIAFKYSNSIYLNFFNLGNINHKYGLVEIYNLDKFLDQYTEEQIP